MTDNWVVAARELVAMVEATGSAMQIATARAIVGLAEYRDNEAVEEMIAEFEANSRTSRTSRAPEDFIREAQEEGVEFDPNCPIWM